MNIYVVTVSVKKLLVCLHWKSFQEIQNGEKIGNNLDLKCVEQLIHDVRAGSPHIVLYHNRLK